MFLVSTVRLVEEACKGGIIGGLPRANAQSIEQFETWLRTIRHGLDEHVEANPGALVGPIAVNLANRLTAAELEDNLRICASNGVEIIVSATGDPTELTKRAHDHNLLVFHDVTTLRFAEKAIRAGVDGVTAIGAGGGGHSGTISHLALVPKLRSMFDGVIIMAGAIATGAGIRAAEILGADVAYLGTRFIATQESGATLEYLEMLVSGDSSDLLYTDEIAGVHANWLIPSMKAVGLDPLSLPRPSAKMRYDHLPANVKPWKNLWSAGHGIDLINDVPATAEVLGRLRREYVEACHTPDMADAARFN